MNVNNLKLVIEKNMIFSKRCQMTSLIIKRFCIFDDVDGDTIINYAAFFNILSKTNISTKKDVRCL